MLINILIKVKKFELNLKNRFEIRVASCEIRVVIPACPESLKCRMMNDECKISQIRNPVDQ